MTDSPTTDIRLCHLPHLNRGLDPRRHTPIFQSILEGQRVKHGGQHTHVIGRNPVHTFSASGSAAPDVTPTDHNGNLHTHFNHFSDLTGDPANYFRIDPV